MKTAEDLFHEIKSDPTQLLPILRLALLDARCQGYTEAAAIISKTLEPSSGYFARLILTARDRLKEGK